MCVYMYIVKSVSLNTNIKKIVLIIYYEIIRKFRRYLKHEQLQNFEKSSINSINFLWARKTINYQIHISNYECVL